MPGSPPRRDTASTGTARTHGECIGAPVMKCGVGAWVPDQPLTVVVAGMCASSVERGSGLMFYFIEILRVCSPCAPLGPAHSSLSGTWSICYNRDS